MTIKNYKICVVGLGYVGLPLAIELSKFFPVTGIDVSLERINELKVFKDSTGEVSKKELMTSLKSNLKLTSTYNDTSSSNVYIVTVPTPINKLKQPDLSYLISSSNEISRILKKNDIVIYESTTYPGCTEELCVPILEKESKLKFNKDFFVGYSPERINPGDKIRRLPDIKKVISGSNKIALRIVKNIYSKIISAGIYEAPSIKVAEASKAIENAQRDLNISFVNELSMIFKKMNIDTKEVIDAAKTKWNFIPFKPGLVGGHCIGVDPYYLVYKAKKLGYDPKVIKSGRAVNDKIPNFIFESSIELAVKKKINISKSNVLILGLTFKEDCPDVRNSKVFDLIALYRKWGINLDVYDPLVERGVIKQKYDLDILEKKPDLNLYQIIILAVPHKVFKQLKIKTNSKKVIFDVKSTLPNKFSDLRL